MSVATSYLLESSIAQDFELLHVDTADRRSLSNVGRLDVTNMLLALLHGCRFLYQMAAFRPSIVYVPVAQGSLGFLRDCLFLIPARLARRRVIIHIHGGHFGRFRRASSPFISWLIDYACGRATQTIVLGESLRGMVDGLVDADSVRVVPNGIEDFVAEAWQPSAGNPHNVLFVSNLIREKGILELLEVVPDVLNHVPDANFTVIGDWLSADDCAAAEQSLHRSGCSSAVRFVGSVAPPDLFEYYRQAAMFVLPTYYACEGQPYVILEAMCAGLPVVSTPIGCIAETVDSGSSGLLVEPHDKVGLAESIVRILEDADLSDAMSRASRRLFRERYTRERWSRLMNRVFSEGLENHADERCRGGPPAPLPQPDSRGR